MKNQKENEEKLQSIVNEARSLGMQITQDIPHAKLIANKLVDNAWYCPCQPQHTKDTLCPCRNLRKFKVCRCGFFKKASDN